jgi:hypothetical protein
MTWGKISGRNATPKPETRQNEPAITALPFQPPQAIAGAAAFGHIYFSAAICAAKMPLAATPIQTPATGTGQRRITARDP